MQDGRGQTIQRRVRLWCIHAKGELIKGAEISCLCSGANIFGRIIDDQSVSLCQKWYCRRALVFARVPGHGPCWCHALVHGNRVSLAVGAARYHNVNSTRCDGKRSIVPCERHKVSNLVVGSRSDRSRCDHLNSSRR